MWMPQIYKKKKKLSHRTFSCLFVTVEGTQMLEEESTLLCSAAWIHTVFNLKKTNNCACTPGPEKHAVTHKCAVNFFRCALSF